MPYSYRRRGFRKRKYPKRKSTPWYSRVGGYISSGVKTAAMAASALKTANYIAGLINVEKKFFDVNQTQVAITNGGGVYPLSQIAQGTDYNQREGNSAKVSSIQCRTNIVMNPAYNVATGQTLRQMIVVDNDNQGSAPAVADILESANINAPINHVNGKRFTVLHDKVYNLVPTAANSILNPKYFTKYGGHLKWSSTTGSSTKEGHIYMLLISDTGTGVDEPLVSFYSRIRYVDN